MSKFCGRIVELSDLHGEVIYMPRGETESTQEFERLLDENNVNCKIKKIDSVTMLNILEQHDGIGFVNVEYIQKDLEQNKITKLESNFKVVPTEYGIYIHKNNNSPELMNFVRILKNRRNK